MAYGKKWQPPMNQKEFEVSEKGHNRFRFTPKHENRNKTVKDRVQKMIDVRIRRLQRLNKLIEIKKQKIIEKSMGCNELIIKQIKEKRSEFLKAVAEIKVVNLEEQIEKVKKEIEALYSNNIIIEEKNIEDDELINEYEIVIDENNLIEIANLWARLYNVRDFVVSVDIYGEKVEIIDLDAARNMKTQPIDGKWPSFSHPPEGSDTRERLERLRALLASVAPDMKNQVGILSTRGMQHKVEIEAMTLRGNKIDVCEDLEALEKGLKSLADFEVVDAEEYKKNFR